MKTLLILLMLSLGACSIQYRAEQSLKKNPNNPALRDALEGFYITKENPENNYPGEVDSLKSEIKTHLK